MPKNQPTERMSAQKGMKIFTGTGPHTVNAYCFVSRVQDTVIASATNQTDGAITLTNYMPSGTKLNAGEVFTFDVLVKTITLTKATDSISIIKE